MRTTAARKLAGWCFGLVLACGCTTPAAPATRMNSRPTKSSHSARPPGKQPVAKLEPSCGPKGLAPPLLTIPRLGDEGVFRPQLFAERFMDYFSQWNLPSDEECCRDGELRDSRELKRARLIAEGWLIASSKGILALLAKDHGFLLLKDSETDQTTARIDVEPSSGSRTITTAALSNERLYLGYEQGGIGEIDLSAAPASIPMRERAKEVKFPGEVLDQLWATGDLLVQLHSGPPTASRKCTDVIATPFSASPNFHVVHGNVGTCGELLDQSRMLVLSNAPGARVWVVDLIQKTASELSTLPMDFVSCGSIKGDRIVISGRRGGTAVLAAHVAGGWLATAVGPASGKQSVSMSGDWVAVGDPTIGVVERGQEQHVSGIVHLLKFTPDGLKLVARIAAQKPTAAALFGRQVLIDGNRLYIGEAGSSWYERQGGTDPAVSVYELK